MQHLLQPPTSGDRTHNGQLHWTKEKERLKLDRVSIYIWF